MEKGIGTGNTPGSQRGRRENEESRPQKMVWGGGNDHDWGRTGIGGLYKAQRLLWVNHAWPAGCPLVDSPLWEPYDRTIFAGHVAARESPSGPATARTRHRCLLDTLTFFCGSAIGSPLSLLCGYACAFEGLRFGSSVV